MRKGIYLAITAYLFWGLHPIYWKLLKHVPTPEIVMNRVIWSLLLFLIIVLLKKDHKNLISKVASIKNKSIIIIPAFLIGSNWLMYIWAVNAGFIIETSLGYFISPLVIIFLGVIILKEKLSPIKWASIAMALIGVLIMTFIYGNFPWISLFLACTWALYSLLRKKSPLSPSEGLAIEALILSIPAFIYFVYLLINGNNSFTFNPETSFLLIGAGIISGLPLLIFISASRLIPFTLIGLLQYIYPSSFLLIGVFIYNEQLDKSKIWGFAFIWLGLLIYTLERIYVNEKFKKLISAVSQIWNR